MKFSSKDATIIRIANLLTFPHYKINDGEMFRSEMNLQHRRYDFLSISSQIPMGVCQASKIAVAVALCLVSLTGSLFPVVGRVLTTSKFPWKNDLQLEFRKPFFQVLLYFLIPCILIIPWLLMCRVHKLSTGMDCVRMYRRAALPAILNCMATYSEFVSLLWMPTIVWQAFHSWQIMFVAVFSFFSKRSPLYLSEWIGLFVVIAGIAICGVSNLLRSIHNRGETSDMFFSYIVIIFACALRAYQGVTEEMLIKMAGFTPLQLTAYEGVWGFCLTLLIVIPLANIASVDSPFYENTLEIFEFVTRSSILVLVELVFVFCSGGTMYLSTVLTEKIGSAARFSTESVRPLLVLVISYASHYGTNVATVGEGFDSYSWGEITGMALSCIGSLMSSRLLQFPCLDYHEQDIHSDGELVSNEFVLH